MIWNDDEEKTTGISREEKYGKTYITYVDIVRCKDCKHRYKGWCCAKHHVLEEVKADFFCADGARKE